MTTAEGTDEPSPAATLERAASLVNEALWTVALQRRRLRTSEPEDEDFIFRPWADWQFFVVALTRARQGAMIATRVDDVSDAVRAAIRRFDDAVPGLRVLRNVAEHIDEYAVDSDKRHHGHVSRRGLQVGQWDETQLIWYLDGPYVLNADSALAAAEDLFAAVRAARDTLSRP